MSLMIIIDKLFEFDSWNPIRKMPFSRITPEKMSLGSQNLAKVIYSEVAL